MFRRLAQDCANYISALRGEQAGSGKRLGDILNCPVFVINLERSKYRREFILGYLSGLGIQAQIHPAVDGALLNMDNLAAQGDYNDAVSHEKFSRSLSRAEIGCTLSHLGIYRKMVDAGMDMALILEDDATFVPRAADHLDAMLREAPADWDLLQLHYACTERKPVSMHIVKFPAEKCMPVGSLAYFIRRTGAEKMLRASYPICYPADSLIGRSPRWGVVLYGSASPLVMPNSVFPTDIQVGGGVYAKTATFVKRAVVTVVGMLFAKKRRST